MELDSPVEKRGRLSDEFDFDIDRLFISYNSMLLDGNLEEQQQEEQEGVFPFSFNYEPLNEDTSSSSITIEPLYPPSIFEYTLEEIEFHHPPPKSLAQLCLERLAFTIDCLPNDALIKECIKPETRYMRLHNNQVKELLLKVAELQPPHLLYYCLPKFPYAIVKEFSKEAIMKTHLTGEAQRQIEDYLQSLESPTPTAPPLVANTADNMKPLVQFFSWNNPSGAQITSPHGVPCRAPSPSRHRSKSPSPKVVSPRSLSPKPTRTSPSTSPRISNSPFVVRLCNATLSE